MKNASPEIDLLMLADWAEAIAGKLYLMGGGFSGIEISEPAAPIRFAVAAMLRVPGGTRGPVPFSMRLERDDGTPIHGWQLRGDLETDSTDGEMQSTAIAATIDVVLPAPAEITLRATFAEDERTVAFRTVTRM